MAHNSTIFRVFRYIYIVEVNFLSESERENNYPFIYHQQANY